MIHFARSDDAQPDSWFVIWTESRAENKVEARIAALGLSPWLPTVKERRRWSDRWREVVSRCFRAISLRGPARWSGTRCCARLGF